MDNIKLFLKNHQQQIVLVIGYMAVAGMAFGLGKFTNNPTQNLVKQTSNPLSNYSPKMSGAQTAQTALNCEGKIKGSASLIYHVPGGSIYYKNTRPIKCFDTEAEAAGFRKSAK
ncbi:MAG TPA: hypothetical protein VF974_08365 [Patescibacteria group bacterium]